MCFLLFFFCFVFLYFVFLSFCVLDYLCFLIFFGFVFFIFCVFVSFCLFWMRKINLARSPADLSVANLIKVSHNLWLHHLSHSGELFKFNLLDKDKSEIQIRQIRNTNQYKSKWQFMVAPFLLRWLPPGKFQLLQSSFFIF